MIKTCYIFFLFSFLLLFSSCAERYEEIGRQLTTARTNKMREDTLIFDSIHKSYFSRIMKPNGGGLQTVYQIPAEHQNKELWVVLEGRIRTNYPHTHSTITLITASEKGEMLCWKASFLSTYYTKLNDWCHFKDSIWLPHNFNNTSYKVINAFAYLGNQPGEKFDMDTLIVTVKRKKDNIF